jgi:hydroxymethylglutaryl-CoA reductase
MTLAGKAEELIHGRASGVDVAAATYGGLILYRRSTPPVPIKTYGQIPIIIALTGQRRMTAKMVAHVGEIKKNNEDLFSHLLYTSSELTKLAATSMQKRDVKTLGRILTFHHHALRWLQVSNKEIEQIVNHAIREGASGAKLTGAGGGGAVIILPKEGAEYSMLHSVRKIVPNAFLSQIPVGGVRSWLEE